MRNSIVRTSLCIALATSAVHAQNFDLGQRGGALPGSVTFSMSSGTANAAAILNLYSR